MTTEERIEQLERTLIECGAIVAQLGRKIAASFDDNSVPHVKVAGSSMGGWYDVSAKPPTSSAREQMERLYPSDQAILEQLAELKRDVAWLKKAAMDVPYGQRKEQ